MLPNSAQEICEAARKRLDERIEQIAEADFGSYEFFLTFGAALRAITIEVVDELTVRATVEDRHFQYLAKEALDVDMSEEAWRFSHIKDDGERAAILVLRCACLWH